MLQRSMFQPLNVANPNWLVLDSPTVTATYGVLL